MTDAVGIAGTVGTWVAVFFAVVALVGIVGPLLVLYQTRSERFQALAAIDSPEYITKGFTPYNGYSFFRKGKVPVLKDPPRPGLTPEVHFFAIPNIKNSIHGAEDGVVTQTTSSSTGWVNFASTIELYNLDFAKGDDLVFDRKQAWLPVHRFWLLAFGLRGRFADRRDKGKAVSSGNVARLRIEGYEAEDRDAAYGSGSLQGRLYGFTGTLWWKVSGYGESQRDEVYFALHPKEDRQLSLIPDPMPLSTLFWLSCGCLPLVNDPRGRVFDLAGFLSANQAYHPNEEDAYRRQQPKKFYRFSKRLDFTGYRTLGNRTTTGLTDRTNSTLPEADETPTNNPGDGTSREWADAMGVDMSRIWCMNRCRRPKDSKAAIKKGLWWSVPGVLHGFSDYVWRSDIQLQAFTIFHLPLSPMGFLFDEKRTSRKDGIENANCKVFKHSWRRLYYLQRQIVDTEFVTSLLEEERAAIERLWSCWPNQKAVETGPAFGRNRTRISYEIDTKILSNRSALPKIVQDIIGILTMTTNTSLKVRTEDGRRKKLVSRTGNGFLDMLIHCMSEPASAESCYLDIDVAANLVQVSCLTREDLDTSMIFKEVFADPRSYENISGRYHNFTEFVLLALKALIRGVMFETAIDSNPLLNLVEKMTDVVNVSTQSRPPPLESNHYIHQVQYSESGSVRRHSDEHSDTSTSSPDDADSENESTHESKPVGSDPDSDPETSNELKQIRLAEQIRDLQYEFNSLQVSSAESRRQDRLDRVGRLKPNKPNDEVHVDVDEPRPGEFIIDMEPIGSTEKLEPPHESGTRVIDSEKPGVS